VQGVTGVNVGISHSYEWRYFASSVGSYIEQEIFNTSPSFSVTAAADTPRDA
jgi:predicted Zn-dependent protease